MLANDAFITQVAGDLRVDIIWGMLLVCLCPKMITLGSAYSISEFNFWQNIKDFFFQFR
jgi:hypothetical protein